MNTDPGRGNPATIIVSKAANPHLEATVLATAAQSVPVAAELCRLSEEAFSLETHKRIFRAIGVVMADTAYEAVNVQLVEGVLRESFPLDRTLAVNDSDGITMVRQLNRIGWNVEVIDTMTSQLEKLMDSTNPSLQLEVHAALHGLRHPPGMSGLPNIEDLDPTLVGSEDPKRRWTHTGFRELDIRRPWRDKSGTYHTGGPSERTLIGIGGESGAGKTRFTAELALRLSFNYTLKYGRPAPIWWASGEMGRREVLDAVGANPAVPTHRWVRAFASLGMAPPLFVISKEDVGSMAIDQLIAYKVDQIERIVHQGMAKRLSEEEILAQIVTIDVTDYLALYLPTGENKVQAMANAALRLKEFALRAPLNLNRYPVLRQWGAICLAPMQIKGAKELMQRGEYHLPTRDSITWARDIVDHLDELILIARDPADAVDGKINLESERRLLVVDKIRHGTPVPNGVPVLFRNGQFVTSSGGVGEPYGGPGSSELSEAELAQLGLKSKQ